MRAGAATSAVLAALLLVACSGRVPRQAATGESKAPRDDFRRVRPTVAFELLRDSPEDMLILDLRTPDEYFGPLGHLRDARNLPLVELPERLHEITAYRRQTILIYCRNDECGVEGVRLLRDRGFENPVLMEGGVEGWVEAGYRTEGVRPPVRTATPPQPVAAPRAAEQRADLVSMRMSDGAIQLGGRPSGLFVAGRVNGNRFEPDGVVQGEGPLCSDLVGEAEPLKVAWRDLSDGTLHVEGVEKPSFPIVRGCVDADGRFHPSSREIEYP